MSAAALQRIERTHQRHKLFVEIITRLARLDWAETKELARRSEVSPMTLYTWVHGETVSPLTRTLFAVAEELGYRLEWKQLKRRPNLTVVK